ncbi:TPA: transporter substrate-binding domain-containing protein [Serratia fonticola]|nr:transporter substrate-binding domain-containing protein [Serratia fonticola]
MMRFLCFIFLLMVCGLGSAAAVQVVTIKSEQDFLPSVSLCTSPFATITIGIYRPLMMPLNFIDNYGALHGVDAEFISLLTNNLQVKSIVKIYDSKDEALAALDKGTVDIILPSLSDQPKPEFRTADTVFRRILLLQTQIVAVTKVQNLISVPGKMNKIKIATVANPCYTAFIKQKFPGACVKRYDEIYAALSSVEDGENDLYIGNSLDTGYYLTNDFSHTLEIKKSWTEDAPGKYLVINPKNTALASKLNDFSTSLSSRQKNNLLDYWIDTNKMLLAVEEMDLTTEETAWLKKNKTVRVLVNPYYAPFTMIDSDHDINGVAGDLLKMISFKTGLKFDISYVNTESEMAEVIKKGRWDIIPSATATSKREKSALFTNSYLSTPYVFLSKQSDMIKEDASTPVRIAVPCHYVLCEFLNKKYPHAVIVNVESLTQALSFLIENKADVALANKVTARFFIDHYFRGVLKYSDVPDAPMANIAFAINKEQPILRDIINKAIENVPPKQITYSVDKWNSVRDPQLNTWKLYRKEFYYVSAFFILLIVTSLIWGIYLLRETRRRKASELHLIDQLNYSAELSNSLPTPLYTIDINGKVGACNNAYLNAVEPHLPTESIAADHPLSTVFKQIKAHIKAGMVPHVVIKFEERLNLRGQIRDVIHWFVPFKRRGDATSYFICGWQDMTDHTRLLHDLQVEKDNAIGANHAKRLFLARMSHEIRTPVSAVIGFLEILQHKYPQDKDIALAYSAGAALLGVAGDVIDIEKIESGSYVINKDWVCIDALLEQITHMFDGLAEQKKLALSYRSVINDCMEYDLAAQPLRQIIVNLLSNAVKFTDLGTVSVNARTEYADVNLAYLIISVTDSGTGIAPEEQDKLFLPFSQTASGKQRQGAGLGLSICRHLANLMEGHLDAHSSSDTGSTFTLKLPVAFRPNRSFGKTSAEVPIANEEKQALSILIVDDSLNNRLLLKKQLLILGYKVDEAANGFEALNAIKNVAYDLVITDLDMPEMSGTELASAVRKFDNQLSIIGLTANAQESERERCIQAGMNVLTFKPIDLKQLNLLLSACPGRGMLHDPTLVFSQLEELFGKDTAGYITFLQQAERDIISDVKEITRNLNDQNWKIIDKRIHRLCGTAQIMSVESLITQLDKYYAIDKSSWPEVQSYFVALMAQLDELVKNIKTIRSRLSR